MKRLWQKCYSSCQKYELFNILRNFEESSLRRPRKSDKGLVPFCWYLSEEERYAINAKLSSIKISVYSYQLNENKMIEYTEKIAFFCL